MGIKIDDEWLNNLRFADDIVLISKDPQELQAMINQLNTYSKAIGLEMNLFKTQIIFNELVDAQDQIIVEVGWSRSTNQRQQMD